MKHCIDCEWVEAFEDWSTSNTRDWEEYTTCLRATPTTENPVSGNVRGSLTCHEMRCNGGVCGPDARLFGEKKRWVHCS